MRDTRIMKISERTNCNHYNQCFFDENLSGIHISDVEGNILDCNKEFIRIFGYRDKAHALSSSITDRYENKHKRQEFLQALRTEDRIIGAEAAFRRIDGKAIHTIINASADYDAAGEISLVKGFILDVTHQHHLKLQLANAQKMESLGTLAGGIAHDFNNILSIILGNSQLAQAHIETPEKALDYIEKITAGAQRAADLVRQILIFSRRTEYRKNPLKLGREVEQSLNLLRSTIPTTIRIEKHIDYRPLIMADPTKIHQIVMNLCTNAYHAMTDTCGIMHVRLYKKRFNTSKTIKGKKIKAGDYAVLEVEDNGAGMDKETLAKAFDPYFTTKEPDQGTGLGLALVQSIVEEHDAFLDVTSRKGKGSRFSIYFPTPAKSVLPIDYGKQTFPNCKGDETIMIVDDEPNITKCFQDILKAEGYTVYCYENGRSAFEAFEAAPNRFDLILTDMTMPEKTGIELIENIRKIDSTVPVILCSGYGELINEDETIKAGVSRYIEKPVFRTALTSEVRMLLDKKKQPKRQDNEIHNKESHKNIRTIAHIR